MNKFLALGLVLSLFSFTACTQNKKIKQADATVAADQKSKADLVTDLKNDGIFDAVQTSSIDSNFEVVSTTEDTDYYLKNGVVVSSSRTPKEGENVLLYWRYQFKGKNYRETEIEEKNQDGHGLKLRQLACDTLGTGVVFNPTTEQVTRVFFYEKK